MKTTAAKVTTELNVYLGTLSLKKKQSSKNHKSITMVDLQALNP
jgi:hypothetical protein